MIKVTVELISAIHPSRSRKLGEMLIANDNSGDRETGNYVGTLHAEYTPKEGRKGMVKNFRRQKQSVFTLIGTFLKLWGHTKTLVVETPPPAPRVDCTCKGFYQPPGCPVHTPSTDVNDY